MFCRGKKRVGEFLARSFFRFWFSGFLSVFISGILYCCHFLVSLIYSWNFCPIADGLLLLSYSFNFWGSLWLSSSALVYLFTFSVLIGCEMQGKLLLLPAQDLNNSSLCFCIENLIELYFWETRMLYCPCEVIQLLSRQVTSVNWGSGGHYNLVYSN